MTLLPSAMAAGIPTPRVTPAEGTGQQISRNGEAPEQLQLALPEACGLIATRLAVHIVVIMLQVNGQR
jgi:hypothetical protein